MVLRGFEPWYLWLMRLVAILIRINTRTRIEYFIKPSKNIKGVIVVSDA